MTLDLIFHDTTLPTLTLRQLAADTGLVVEAVSRRLEAMEVFAVAVWTVRLTGDELDAAAAWLARRGIHTLG